MLGQGGVEADPRGKETGPGLEKEPKVEGEAFQVALSHLELE